MPHVETAGWVYLDDSIDGGSFMIDEVDVWKHRWSTPSDQGCVDLVYGRDHIKLHVYYVVVSGKQVWSAAGEFANNAWAFCGRSVA